ncbi:MAG: DUF427 domain-containing protein [Rhodospirillales bacterium]|nr:DUF427 domain-containing protein [Rhodospirillales bacterium]MDP6803808.1 DUF427 domain-containing protein [Rhodospirillales bacterium]
MSTPAVRGFRFEASPRRVRGKSGRATVADSKHARLLFEPGRIPVYWFPKTDVRMDLLEPAGRGKRDSKGTPALFHVVMGRKRAPDAAFTYARTPAGVPTLKDHVAFVWEAMDAWYEEDEEIFVHARDPYKRVDAIRSRRHVEVALGGTVLAETRKPVLLFETGLPTRYYLPRADVRTRLLVPSPTLTRCPYKGVASYYSVRIGAALHADLVWTYPDPIPECPKIKGLLCFYNEKVDITADGVVLKRPKTHWS